jgi:5'-nucleotidase
MSPTPTRRHAAAGLLCAGAVVAGLAAALPAQADPPAGKASKAKTTEIQVLGLNDFHGQLEPVPSTSSGGRIGATPAGGAEYLATHVAALKATNPNTLFVSAGDLIGATPLTSALFHDEPTIEAFNLMGLDFNGVGNHEFDEGVDELLRMQEGGCHPVDGCQDGDGFGGADFQFLAANVAYKDSGETIFPPYAVRHFNGVKVGVIGMTLEGTPDIVSPAGISTVDFFDEADSVNALVPVLQAQGVETFVVLLHEGGTANGGVVNEQTINSCANPTGALPPIVDRMDDAVDVVVTGHTNWAVNCVIDGKVVTGAAATGRLVTDIDLTVSRATKDVVGVTVENRIVTQTVPKTAAMTALVDKYRTLATPFANRVIGSITASLLRTANPAGESSLGDRIADAQQFDAATAGTGSQFALMNPGGIRADLTYPSSPAGEGDGKVTYGEAFAVQPFGNSLVTMTLDGAQIDAVLEAQYRLNAQGLPANVVLQPSEALSYTVSASAPIGSKVGAIAVDGVPVTATGTYRVTVNSFLADGGDGFPVLREGTDRVAGNVDTDAFENYLVANPSGVTPGSQDRIALVP